MAKEVKKDDIIEDDVDAFIKADEAGEVKTGEERKLEEEDKPDSSNDSEDEELDDETDDFNDSEDDVDVEPSTTEIKEVAGEIPEVRAMRLEITRLRREKREIKQNDILKSKQQKSSNYKEKLKEIGYEDDGIDTLDKAFDIIGEEKGFVRKDQSYKSMSRETLTEFIEEHPEYSVENDKDDIYWNRFETIIKSDYNIENKTSKQLKSIFNRVNKEVKEELGEKVNNGKIEAKKQKIKSVSAGTTTSNSDKPIKVKTNKVVSGHPGLNFKGFDDDEVEEFIK